ncbi:Protein kinase-like domain [Lasallia pustulata]|uniref:protein-ribulosamine 3-kinase n=1 Tax=Lasallia pustulata TaxID=136370 RepID=A0A1W5D7N9_9LECA|nr:Protein kinase-like domain [Lasallia pustulata]
MPDTVTDKVADKVADNMADEVIWDKEIDVPKKWIEFVDENVLASTQIKSIGPHGASYWTRTAEIETEQEDGSALSFFLKVTQHDTGKGMVTGEFASMTALHNTVPDLTPSPIAWGTYASDPNVHFFLCSFVDMTDDVPDIQKFTAKIAELHKKSASPTGKYGFSIPTYLGTIPQETAWTDSWEEFFTKSMKRWLVVEENSQGYDEEMKRLSEALLSKVIPRLLRPLETGGRKIQPCLVHGDLWDGNTSSNAETDSPVIFDASCVYAHNEVEMAPWRPIRHKIGKPYVRAYHKHFPISAPEEDQDDRNALYCIRFNMCSSALYPGNLRFRRIIIEEMRALVEKFPDGYEGWEKEKDIHLNINEIRSNPAKDLINYSTKKKDPMMQGP